MDRPFIKLFSTVNGYYVFDVNTNTITKISQNAYKQLIEQKSEKHVDDITKKEIEDLKGQGLLSNFRARKITHLPLEIITGMLDNYTSTLVLQLTQRCNLRCSYCAYTINTDEIHHRKHSNHDMTWEIAKEAVDFYLIHSKKVKYPSVAFYGGEPLLKFDLIKSIILYVEKTFRGKKVDFRITTNGTLLTEDVISFFEDHNVLLTVSLDGSKHIHDEHRRFAANGKGSYDVIKKNLKRIKKEHPLYINKCSINMVMDSQNEFKELNRFFLEDKEEIGVESVMTTEIDDLFSEQKNIYSDNYMNGRSYQFFLKYMEYFGRIPYGKLSDIIDYMVFQDINSALDFARMEELAYKEIIGGCCIPGQLHLLCDYKGDFFPCERVNEKNPMMNIGNIQDGYFYDKIERLLCLHNENEKKCLECWASRHCDICVRHINNEGKVSFTNGMSRYCMASKRHLEDTIRTKIFLDEIYDIYHRQIGGKKFEEQRSHNLSV